MAAANRIKLPGWTTSIDLHDARIAQIETTVNNNENPVTGKAVKTVTDKKAGIVSDGYIDGAYQSNLDGVYAEVDGIREAGHDEIYGIYGTEATSHDSLPDEQILITKKYVDDAIAALRALL